jgi:DNA recombination protein RmuC
LEKVTVALQGLAEKNEKSHEALRFAVEQRLDAIRQESASKLEEMRQTVDEKLQSTLESRLGESFNRVVDQLTRVHEGLGEMKSLASNVGDLKNVLTNVKVRGTFGEVQLELLLEQFLAPDQYVKDAQVCENSSERVEFAIRLPGKGSGEEVLLAIDAKFPRESYDRLMEASQAGDTQLVEQHRRQLEAQIRSCAKEICKKYVNPPRTTDFAILFLPTEGLYAEVLRQPGVFESIQREHKVTLAGPTTLSAILNALQMGFRTLAIEQRSSEVWQILGAVQSEFKKYNSVVDRLAKQLSGAANSVDRLGQRARAMNRALREVEALPEGVSEAALLDFDGEDVTAVQEDEQEEFFPVRSDIAIPVSE